MGFIVHRSERADILADALADELAVALADPFRAEVVAVHAKGIERWLAHRLAARLGASPGRADGVCANLQLPFPGRLVGDALARATGVDPATDPWRPERLVWPLLDVVDANLDQPWLHVLAHHLGRSESEPTPASAAAKATRRFAAVRHIADLFDRYAVHRPAMLQAWADGRDDDGAAGAANAGGRPLPEDAEWQAELWRRLRDVIPAASPPERLATGCAELVANPAVVDLPDRFFLFGLTRLPVSYLDVLAALATHRDIHLLALHPSPQLWQSLTADPTVGADAAAALVHHPLLRAWGRDSREMQVVIASRLAAAGTVVDRHHPVPETAPATLLHHLQHAIRHDVALPVAAPGAAVPDPDHPSGQVPGQLSGRPSGQVPDLAPDDRSVQVHRCHGRSRQAEVVRDAITHLLADDLTLEPRDIVVMCPDIDEFAPLLRAAFDGPAAARDGAVDLTSSGAPVGGGDGGGDGGAPSIPYRLADRSLRQTNPVLGAVAELLALADARLTAAQVLAFAALGPVRDRFGFDDDDLETMARWIGDAGIRWGLDAEHRRPYDLAAVDTGTWAAGLRRLLLGVAMADEDERLVGGVVPLDDVDPGAIDLAGRVAELVGRLADAVASLAGPLPVGDWMAAIDAAASALFFTRSRDAWQRQQLDRLVRDVGGESGDAADLDPGERNRAGRPVLGLAELRDLLADRLRGQPTRAAFRTGDLTLCTLVPMRSVPHRVVCLVGLDDGSFPRGGAPDGDDLLARPDVRQPGDHDRRAEDRQLLLDAVLAATDALVITYAGRDPSTNEERPPAVPVNELLDVLDRTAVAPARAGGTPRPVRDLIVHDHPLQPADRRYFEPDSLELGQPWGFAPALLAGAAALAAPAPATTGGDFLPEPLTPLVEPVIALDDLVRFVEHPVQAFLLQRLGLRLKERDDRPADRLTIELDGLGGWKVGNRILVALLSGGDADAVCAAERARGLLPPGGMGDASLAKARDKAVAIAEAARHVADGRRTSLDIDVTLRDGRQLVGAVPDVLGDVIRPVTFSRLAPKRLAAAWVRFLAASASHPGRALSCTLVGSGSRKPAIVTFPPLGATEDERRRRALDLLAVVVDLRDRGLCEPLPLATATSHRYAAQVRDGNPDALESAASAWTSTFDWAKEDRDLEHVRVFGGVITFDDLCAEGPAADEAGPGWADAEGSRFGRLSRRLWDPILDAMASGAVPVPESWR